MKRKLNPIPNVAQAGAARPELSEEATYAFPDGRDPAEAFLDQDLFCALRRRVLERVLRAEIDFHLASSPGGNRGNGQNRKTVHTKHGSGRLAVPRDRQGTPSTFTFPRCG